MEYVTGDQMVMISNIGLRYGRYLPEIMKSRLYPVYHYIRDAERYLLHTYRQHFADEVIETEYGFRMSVDKSDFVQRRYLTQEGESEEDLVECLVCNIENTDGAFLDIGANVGFYSLLFASYSSEPVFAFEPLDYNVNKLEHNIELNGFEKVEILPIGLSNQPGKSEIYYHPFNRGAAGDSMTGDGLNFLQRSETASFDKLDALSKISTDIGLAKIDVEGCELDVLKGAEKTIREQKPRLFIELHPELLAQRGQSVSELVEYVFELGYDSIKLIPEGTELTYREAKASIERLNDTHTIILE